MLRLTYTVVGTEVLLFRALRPGCFLVGVLAVAAKPSVLSTKLRDDVITGHKTPGPSLWTAF
jgi:hypothetical protein